LKWKKIKIAFLHRNAHIAYTTGIPCGVCYATCALPSFLRLNILKRRSWVWFPAGQLWLNALLLEIWGEKVQHIFFYFTFQLAKNMHWFS
jgi:hypothetical protein